MDTRTDSDLMAAYADACDENAFAELVARHQQMVYRVCLRMLRHHQEAEDATQAVFLVLLNKASRLMTRKGEFTGWIYGVARNVCLEALRKRARRQEEAMLDETEEPAVEEYRPAHEEVMPFLDEELAGLTGVLRQAVVLRYLQGYSQAEAARQADCSEVTLSVRASRGIERLRQRLAKRGVALGGAALAGLLTSEASAAVPETLLPSILATVKTAVATTATATGATSAAAMLAKGAMKAMFIAKVKMVAAVAATSLVVAGGGTIVAQEVAAQRKAAEQPAAAPPVAEGNSADRFASPAWRGVDASYDLERVGIRVYQIGGWGPGGSSGWATPAELRRRTMPATNYVNAWATSQEREVLWQSSNTVAVIGTKAELDAMKQRAGGEAATVEKILALLSSFEGPPAGSGYHRGYWKPEQDQAALRKTFLAAEGMAKVDAAIVLCAAGGDDGLAFLKAELSKQGADTNSWASGAAKAFGVNGGPQAIEMLRAIFLEYRGPTRTQDRRPLLNGAAFALCQNGSDNAVEAMRSALKSDDTNTTYLATFGLEFLGGKAGLELAALALAHADPKVRRAGAFGAYRAHGERALPLLEKTLTDKDADVRKMVANGLANIGGDKAADLIQRQLAIEKDPAVVKALKDAEAQCRSIQEYLKKRWG